MMLILLFMPQLFLVDKTDVSWWTMQTPEGRSGLVPVNYIDKLDVVPEQAAPPPSSSSSSSNVVGRVAAPVDMPTTATPTNGVAETTGQPVANHVNSPTSPDEVRHVRMVIDGTITKMYP